MPRCSTRIWNKSWQKISQERKRAKSSNVHFVQDCRSRAILWLNSDIVYTDKVLHGCVFIAKPML